MLALHRFEEAALTNFDGRVIQESVEPREITGALGNIRGYHTLCMTRQLKSENAATAQIEGRINRFPERQPGKIVGSRCSPARNPRAEALPSELAKRSEATHQ